MSSHLSTMLEAFTDDLERSPTSAEIAQVLTAAFASLDGDLFAGDPRGISVEVSPRRRRKRGGPSTESPVVSELVPRPVYTGDSAVADGRWPIVGRGEAFLPRFPAEPEIYHGIWPVKPDPNEGPYGWGETADGKLRELTHAEGREIGLFDSYQQTLMPETLEIALRAGGALLEPSNVMGRL